MAVRHLINEPFALWRPAIVSGHLGGGGGFVDEDKSLRIEARLLFAQGLTGRDDVFPILLGGADALFLNASLILTLANFERFIGRAEYGTSDRSRRSHERFRA
jgi:hypothetical protein